MTPLRAWMDAAYTRPVSRPPSSLVSAVLGLALPLGALVILAICLR